MELIFLEKFTAEFSASATVVYKNPPPMGPDIFYTAGTGFQEGIQTVHGNFPPSGV